MAWLLPILGQLAVPVFKAVVFRPDPTYRKYYQSLITSIVGLAGVWWGLDDETVKQLASVLFVLQPVLTNLIGNRV